MIDEVGMTGKMTGIETNHTRFCNQVFIDN